MATTTIGGMTLGSAANLTGAAKLEMEDSTGASVYYSAATLRTKMFAGSTGYTAADPLVVGTVTASGNVDIATATGVTGSGFTLLKNNGGNLQLLDGSNLMKLGTMSTVGGAVGNLCISNGTAATANPVGGGFLWVEAGALKYRGSSGTISTIAAA